MTTRLTQCLVGFATLSLSQLSYAAQDETIWVTIDALAAEHFQQDTVSKRKLYSFIDLGFIVVLLIGH